MGERDFATDGEAKDVKLLVLGRTGFLGYHAVTAALGAGHEVSTFTREGEVAVDGAEPVTGAVGGLSAPRGREWDAVLDTFNGPVPVAATARLLSGWLEPGCA